MNTEARTGAAQVQDDDKDPDLGMDLSLSLSLSLSLCVSFSNCVGHLAGFSPASPENSAAFDLNLFLDMSFFHEVSDYIIGNLMDNIISEMLIFPRKSLLQERR